MDDKRGLFDSLFPPRHDFYRMLREQADQTVRGVDAFIDWLDRGDLADPTILTEEEQRADDLRHLMEDRLMEAFTTPFDRQDIYQFSRQFDYILNYCLSTAVEMRAFEVSPDPPIHSMAHALGRGVREVAQVIHIMEIDHLRAQGMVRQMRRWEKEIENTYVEAMATAFRTEGPVGILKRREIYHHLKDAGQHLRITIDILHRIAVGLA